MFPSPPPLPVYGRVRDGKEAEFLGPSDYMRSRAFTLIELLVVIAIIAILAAILFPVFAQAKTAAKKSANLSNHKQDIVSCIMYASDYDDVSVPTQASPNGWADTGNYQLCKNRGQLIQPYMKNYQILRDPLDPNANDATLNNPNANCPTVDPNKTLCYQYNSTERSNHGYNFFYLSPMIGPSNNIQFVGRSLTSIGRPGSSINNVDSVWSRTSSGAPSGGGNWFVQAPSYWNSGTGWWFGPWAFTNNASWFQYGGAFDFVKGSVAMNFVDGHSKIYPTPALWGGSDPITYSVFDQEKYLWGGHTN